MATNKKNSGRPRTGDSQRAARQSSRQQGSRQQGSGQQGSGRQESGRQESGRQGSGQQGSGRQGTGRQGTGRQASAGRGSGSATTGNVRKATPRSTGAAVPAAASAAADARLLDGWSMPPLGASYPQLLRGPSFSVWRSLAGVGIGVFMFLLLTVIVSQAVVLAAWAITTPDLSYADYYASAFAFERPSGMLGAHLGIATLIPISIALMVFLHHTKAQWLISVEARPRWRYFAICAGLAFVALTASLIASQSVASTGPLAVAPQSDFWLFLVVIVLTSPFQAAAEEIFFRGYLMQALGSLFAQPWVGVVASSLLFALFHGTQNIPLFVDRLAFGLLAAWLVWRTGGLEAGIAAHVVNNIMAFTLAGLTTSIADVKAIREIGWIDAAFDVGGFALFALLAYVVARRLKLRRTVEA